MECGWVPQHGPLDRIQFCMADCEAHLTAGLVKGKRSPPVLPLRTCLEKLQPTATPGKTKIQATRGWGDGSNFDEEEMAFDDRTGHHADGLDSAWADDETQSV
jgi:hypothetical protein